MPPRSPSQEGPRSVSLRHRLLAVSGLGAIACIAALVAVAWLAHTSEAQRTERARDYVTREVEGILSGLERGFSPRERRVRRGASGLLDGSFQALRPDGLTESVRTAREITARECAERGELVVREFQDQRPRRPRFEASGEGLLVLAVAPDGRGGYAWARQWVPETRGAAVWRLAVLALALSTLALVVAGLHTLRSFERGAMTLSRTLTALTHDLGARVERPELRELASVSDGIASLAEALTDSQSAQARLSRELSHKERLASLGRVAAGVAHEVRNPLASIKLRVDLVERALRQHGAQCLPRRRPLGGGR